MKIILRVFLPKFSQTYVYVTIQREVKGNDSVELGDDSLDLGVNGLEILINQQTIPSSCFQHQQ